MEHPIVKRQPKDTVNLFLQGEALEAHLRTSDTGYAGPDADPIPRWFAVNSNGVVKQVSSSDRVTFLENLYKERKSSKKIHRFPRLGIPDEITNF